MQKDFWKGMFRPENKKMRSNVFLALMAGVLLLVGGKSFSAFSPKGQEEPPPQMAAEAVTNNEVNTERRMAAILSQIHGAGQVEVMLTYQMTEEKQIAQEEKREETRGEENGKTSETLRTETTVVLTEDSRGTKAPLVLSTISPKIEGVVIVAQGGGDPVVCQALNQAAQALLDVPAHKIAVLKMK
ncbi:MAG: hypothetical protein IKI88_01480 [Anaerotignum sp.]|nr:hypothetical protein [Anaerotignum sp.]